MTDRTPSAEPAADEPIVRKVAAQIDAIWPQEVPLLQRYALPANPLILDVGCGSGEGSARLADLFPAAKVVGVDNVHAQLELARGRYKHLARRLSFEHQSIYDLDGPAGRYDLTVCRHVLQATPHPDQVLGELARVTRPGGTLHLVAEDYGMLHFQWGTPDPRTFWNTMPPMFGAATNTDTYIGRHTFEILTDIGLRDITIDYAVVDTLRVPREGFAAVFEAWRDAHAASIAEITGLSYGETLGAFNQMIANIRNPRRYAVWFVPIISARVPA